MTRPTNAILQLTVTLLAVTILLAGGGRAEAKDSCLTPDVNKNLIVNTACDVLGGTSVGYRNVNIVAGGVLNFLDGGDTHFWASSILVENGGSLIAGTPSAPIGTKGGVVTIHLYGADQGPGTGKGDGGKGITCLSDPARCGVPADIWDSNGNGKVVLPGGVSDFFYQYKPLPYDDGGNPAGYFGYKVLGVSYGGTLQLFGKQGATYGTATGECGEVAPSTSGTSWARLNATAKAGATSLTVDRKVFLKDKDQIVVTTTDYLPGHSEQLTVKGDVPCGTTIKFINPLNVDNTLKYDHNGTRFPLDATTHPGIERLGLSSELTTEGKGAETRAAVALLNRSIRIVSAGDKVDQGQPDLPGDSFFGGHTIVRQGFKTFQVQGVEFKQLGQGGRIGHYPIHFHMARKTPADTFVKDSSINESMTRWIVLHSTHGVTVARNVGYKSIGHGFYLEDGTEINNTLTANIGIYARAAVMNADGTAQRDNPRKVPGILAAQRDPRFPENVPFYSDYDHPAVFWIMNGWNDFQDNMAAGAGTCGMCYWLVPGANSGHSRDMTWESYGSLQQSSPPRPPEEALLRAGMTPVKTFAGNYCSSAMMSFNTIGNTAPCSGVAFEEPSVHPVPNLLAPAACDQHNPYDSSDGGVTKIYHDDACTKHVDADAYYPKVETGGGRFATQCDGTDCSTVNRCDAASLDTCMVTVLDRYTSSFHWAQQNVSAIWLRPQWYLMTNSVLSDVQNGGLTFVTGGGYTSSDVITGYWGLARKNAFIGATQPDNPYASNAGPFSPGGLSCDPPFSAGHCLSAAEGVSFPLSNFAVNQRLFNIYDGPSYQDSNAYLDIRPTEIKDCQPFTNDCKTGVCVCLKDTDCPTGKCTASGQCACSDNKNSDQGNPDCPGKSACANGLCPGTAHTCDASKSMYGRVPGIPHDQGVCKLPNAAIGWKQPNGFYYPPAFHSTTLFFDKVDFRHFVIEPLFQPGTFLTDRQAVTQRYCTWSGDMFDSFTDIDRQTELNDDDGSLTGYVNTISVNLDPFFTAPVETVECASDLTAKTSPYDYVTTVVYAGCGLGCGDAKWAVACENSSCFGVPLYRQLLTSDDDHSTAPSIRLMGQATAQRSSLTVNHGVYYIDTTVGADRQTVGADRHPAPQKTVFEAGQPYYVFLIFAKPTTKQTYQMYVGVDLAFDATKSVSMTRADIHGVPVTFTAGDWPPHWTRDYDKSTGILTVTMDMNFDDFTTGYATARQTNCQPVSYCKWNKPLGPCQCAPGSACIDNAVCGWAGKDIDCPEGGCFGFEVALSAAFTNNTPVDRRPAATCFPTAADQGWNVDFELAPPGLAGACPTDPLPAKKFCH